MAAGVAAENRRVRRRTWSRGDVAFAVAFAAYVGLSLVLLGLGVLARLASISPDVHLQLHITGFADSNMVERVALGIAGASHLPQSIGGIALDYAFSVFNIGLALFLLRLRPRNVTARLLAVGMTGTSALFNLQASAYLGEEALTG